MRFIKFLAAMAVTLWVTFESFVFIVNKEDKPSEPEEGGDETREKLPEE